METPFYRESHSNLACSGDERWKNAYKPTPYRHEQKVIKDSSAETIAYMPPKAKDFPELMRNLVSWIKENEGLLCPIKH